MKTFAAALLAATAFAGAGHYGYRQQPYSYKPTYQKSRYQPTATTQWQPTVKPYQNKYEVPYYKRDYDYPSY